MSVLPKPTDHIDWTDGNPLKITEPTSGKKLLGWALAERPPFQFMNWLFWQLDNWDKYLESITDDHETRIDAIEAALPGLGTAAGISASNAGHTIATGTNVQAQLDELDQFGQDIENAITSGLGIDLVGYVPLAPGNWSPAPTHAGPALDQLASRMVAVEAAAQNTVFINKSFTDYVIPADDPNGGGNEGLTDTIATNPLGLKFADLRMARGEQRIVFMDIKRTGNFDSSGRPEWKLVTPKDDRVRFYGTWQATCNGPAGLITTSLAAGSVNGTWSINSNKVGDYFTVTGVFDAIGLSLANVGTNHSNDIEVEIDTVNTGVPLSAQATAVPIGDQGNVFTVISDASLKGLTHDIHTVKFIQNDAVNPILKVNGVSLVSSNIYQLPGKKWVDKAVINYATKTIVSPPSVTNKGGKVLRYVDRTDTLQKELVNNTFVLETSSVSIGSGATSISVLSSTGFQAGDIILITDGPTNSEKLLVQSVGVGTITVPAPGTVNSYTSPTISVYGRTLATTTHANEMVKGIRNLGWFGNGDNNTFNSPNQNIATLERVWWADDGASGVVTSAGWSSTSPAGFATPVGLIGLYPVNPGEHFQYHFKGTGLDVIIDSGTAPTGVFAVSIDGVFVGNLSFTAITTKCFKICSDLPEGEHVVQFVSGLSGNIDDGICEFIEYETALPTNSLQAGDILSTRTIQAQYLWDKTLLIGSGTETFPFQTRTSVSRGVVRQHFLRGAKFVDGTGGSSNWAMTDAVTNPGNIGWVTDQHTGASVKKWFFGTGFDIPLVLNAAYQILQLKVDGNNLTTANFPTAVMNGTNFNATTGLYDGYTGGTANQGNVVSIANLSTTPQWHLLEVLSTGTKNPSASAFDFEVYYIDVHNMPFDVEQPHEVVGACSELFVGGVLDKRRKSAEDDGVKFPNYCRGVKMGTYSSANTTASPQGRMLAKIKTQGYPIKITAIENFANSAASANFITLMINSIPYQVNLVYTTTSGFLINAVLSAIVNLPAGFYAIQLYESCNAGVFSGNTGGEITVEEMVPQRRA